MGSASSCAPPSPVYLNQLLLEGVFARVNGSRLARLGGRSLLSVLQPVERLVR